MSINSKFLTASTVACLAVLLCSSDMFAQGGRGGRGGGGGGFRGGGNIGSAQMLRRDDVRKELELTQDQLEELEDLNRDGGGIDREALREELREMSAEERRDRITEIRAEMEETTNSKLSEILLPFQVERLSQLTNQITIQMMARTGTSSLVSGPIAEKLKVTDEQKDKIREKAEKLKKEYDEKVAELRKDMEKELLGELTSKQRSDYDEMMGEAFKFENTRGAGGRGGRGGDRGGRGGRGGDRGGRGGGRPERDGDGDA